MATATEDAVTVSGAERAGLARLLEEQSALRRVATLAARGVAPDELFAAVTEEVGQVLGAELAALARFESDRTATMVAVWERDGSSEDEVGVRWALEGENVLTRVALSGRSTRMDGTADASGPIGLKVRQLGVRSQVGTPVIVDGHLWGAMIAGSLLGRPLPPDTERRLGDFTDLLGSAIANADSRSELAASRARIVAASDETRRRIERDLHDGAQQRLVSLGLLLRAAQARVPAELRDLDDELSTVARGLAEAQEELREIARGIHPAILAEGGLGPALKTLCRRSPVPVELSVTSSSRLPAPVEVAGYYVISEALTNTAKHAGASVVRVTVEVARDALRIAVHDDGGGGADPARGSGLIGLKDRVEALGGTLSVSSPPGAGTSVYVEIPITR